MFEMSSCETPWSEWTRDRRARLLYGSRAINKRPRRHEADGAEFGEERTDTPSYPRQGEREFSRTSRDGLS